MTIPYGYCHCGCGQLTAIAKKTQTNQGDVAGKPRKYVKFHQPKPGRKRLTDETFIDALWAKVDKSPGQGPKGNCWCFNGSRDGDGYGVMRRVGYPPFRAHRIVLSLKIGRELQDNEQSLHRCDNPPCVRPSHLFVGTNIDNVADRHKKGRTRILISQEVVNEIRNLYVPRKVSIYALAKRYNVSPTYVFAVVKGMRRFTDDA